MTQPHGSDMNTWPIERGVAPSGCKVARVDTPYGWLMVAPTDNLSDADIREMGGIFEDAHGAKDDAGASVPQPQAKIVTGL